MKLAINGGKPTREKYLSYGSQYIDEKDINSVVEVLKSDFLTTGPKIKELEEIIADYVGSKYAVAYSNGTAALHGACYALDIGKGDEVITTPLTFAASSNCVLYQGGRPVFADVNVDNYNISVESIKEKITDNTKAIIPVDFTGQSVDIDGIKEAIGDRDIKIIQDAAHSLGTKYKGEMIGSISDMTMFSFHPVKTITTGEGGIITTNNGKYYERLMDFRTHGIIRDKDRFRDNNNSNWYYEQIGLGYNYRMTDMQAALGISQFSKLDDFINRRKGIVEIYNRKLGCIDELILQDNPSYSDTVNHLYIIRLKLDELKADRNEIYDAFIAENIGVNVHYIPVYLHPYYQDIGYEKGICPVAEEIYESIITLPLFPSMTDEDVRDVVDATKKIIKYYRK